MNFLKKAIFAPLAFVAAAASVHAVAAPINHTIQLEAFIPTNSFYVLPSDSSWIGNTQKLSYNPVTQDLTSLNKTFDVVHTAGSITAKLLSSAVISSGGDTIPLTVKFNNVELSTVDQEVVNATQAATPSVVPFLITPVKPSGGYVPGTYIGNVQLSFDAVDI